MLINAQEIWRDDDDDASDLNKRRSAITALMSATAKKKEDPRRQPFLHTLKSKAKIARAPGRSCDHLADFCIGKQQCEIESRKHAAQGGLMRSCSI